MAITHSAAVKNGICDYTVDLIDGGTGDNGQIIFRQAGTEAVATIDFQDPAFSAASAGELDDGVAEALGVPLEDTNVVGGTITNFSIHNKDGTSLITGTANTTTGDIVLTSATLANGETLRLTELYYVVP